MHEALRMKLRQEWTWYITFNIPSQFFMCLPYVAYYQLTLIIYSYCLKKLYWKHLSMSCRKFQNHFAQEVASSSIFLYVHLGVLLPKCVVVFWWSMETGLSRHNDGMKLCISKAGRTRDDFIILSTDQIVTCAALIFTEFQSADWNPSISNCFDITSACEPIKIGRLKSGRVRPA